MQLGSVAELSLQVNEVIPSRELFKLGGTALSNYTANVKLFDDLLLRKESLLASVYEIARATRVVS